MLDDKDKCPANDRKIRFHMNILGTKRDGKSWIPVITVISFFLSATLLFVSSRVMEGVSIPVAFGVVFLIVIIGIVFDIIGISVTAADEVPLHAMASRKIFGARRAIWLVRNAHKVSSICNDVVGDICSVISGSASALIIVRLTYGRDALEATLIGLAISGMVASFTVGGKAFGKTFGIKNSNSVVYKVAELLMLISGWTSVIVKKRKKHI